MTALWLRDGDPQRVEAWRTLRRKYPAMRILSRVRNNDKPWLNTSGATFELASADKLLRYIHVMPNPKGRHGYPDLLTVGEAVGRVLDVAIDLGVKKVGLIHIPAYPGGRRPAKTTSQKQKDGMSAGAMIGALGEWDASHPNKVTDVYVVDLHGCFKPFVWRAGVTPKRSQTPPPPE